MAPIEKQLLFFEYSWYVGGAAEGICNRVVAIAGADLPQAVVEEIIRVQGFIAYIVHPDAVIIPCSGLGHDLNVAARHPTEFSLVVAHHDLDLGDRFHRNPEGRVGGASDSVQGDAIQREAIIGAAAPSDIEIDATAATPTQSPVVGADRIDHTGRYCNERCERASVDSQVGDLGCRNRGRAFRAGGLHGRGVRRHHDLLCHRTQFQVEAPER